MTIEAASQNPPNTPSDVTRAPPVAPPPDAKAKEGETKEEESALSPGEAAKEARLSAELRARKERLKKKTDAFYAQQKEFEATRAKHEETAKEAEKRHSAELAALKKELEELRTGNPLLRADGPTADRMLKEFVSGKAPERQLENLEKALAAQRAEFETKLEEMRAAETAKKEEERQAQHRVQTQYYEAEMGKLATAILSPAAREHCKHIQVLYTPQELLTEIRRIHKYGAENGKAYTGRDIAEYLEKKAAKRYQDLEQRRAEILSAAPAATTPAATGSASGKPAPASAGKVSPRQSRKLTRAEQEEADKAMLRKAFAKDAAARK